MKLTAILVALAVAVATSAQQPAEKIRLDAPEGWVGETITLPPPFAPDSMSENGQTRAPVRCRLWA